LERIRQNIEAVKVTGKTNEITLDSKVRLSKTVLFTTVDQETVLLNSKTGKYFGLDEIGTTFWKLLSKNIPPREAYEMMLDEYEVAPSELEKDILELVGQLEKHGLLEIIHS
jgi:hypothetical protein